MEMQVTSLALPLVAAAVFVLLCVALRGKIFQQSTQSKSSARLAPKFSPESGEIQIWNLGEAPAQDIIIDIREDWTKAEHHSASPNEQTNVEDTLEQTVHMSRVSTIFPSDFHAVAVQTLLDATAAAYKVMLTWKNDDGTVAEYEGELSLSC